MKQRSALSNEPNIYDFNPARDVPKDLRPYLITVNDPNEVYAQHVRASERRLRLLYRRFLNQITYGCKNTNCNVPTCFSYRKRFASRPIRPYTDVSAAALAVECVEQYANREIGSATSATAECSRSNYPDETLKERLGQHGLCRNDPVIPWYAEPQEYLAKLRAAAASRPPRSLRDSTSRKQSSTVQEHKQGHPHSSLPSKVLVGDTHPGSLGDQLSLSNGQSKPAAGTDTGAAPASLPSDEPSGSPLADDETARQQQRADYNGGTLKHKDPASFTQTLFARPEFQSRVRKPQPYFKTVSGPSNAVNVGQKSGIDRDESPSEHSVSSKGIASNGTTGSDKHESTTSETVGAAPTTFSQQTTYTFKLLPLRAILWLKEMHSEQMKNSEPRASKQPEPTTLNRFIEQTLYFVLKDPHRLIMSASTWDSRPEMLGAGAPNGIARCDLRSNLHRGETTDDAVLLDDDALCKLDSGCCTSLERFPHPDRRSAGEIFVDLVYLLHKDSAPSQVMNHLLMALRQCFLTMVTARDSELKAYKISNEATVRTILLALNLAWSIRDLLPTAEDTGSPLNFSGGESALGTSYDRSATSRLPFLGPAKSVPSSCDPASKISRSHSDRLWMYDHDFSQVYTTIADIFSHRMAVCDVGVVQKTKPGDALGELCIITSTVEYLVRSIPRSQAVSVSDQLLEFMQAVLLSKWDRKPVVKRASPAGGALEMLKGLYYSRRYLEMPDSWFCMDFVEDTFDEVDMPYTWLSFRPDSERMHILQFPYFFPPEVLVRYFRSLNFKIMKLAHEKAIGVLTNTQSQILRAPMKIRGLDEVLDKARPHMNRWFVMTIRRDHVLEDAIGQIWRRERQELSRPLRVRIGQEQGEEGLDHGGVQQEFFRLVFAEAFDANYGMFRTDPTTHMSWFQPALLEPLYKYEALGMLLSLAVYNGVIVPITMPLAFYRKVLGLKVEKIEHIEDGWPEVAKSFQQLLDWKDGDVGETIGQTYEFTYDAFGKPVTVNMSRPARRMSSRTGMTFSKPTATSNSNGGVEDRALGVNGVHFQDRFISLDVEDPTWPSSKAGEERPSAAIRNLSDEDAPLVTNINRHKFVEDYIMHLTDITIAPQFSAFLRGLYTLLSPQSLSLFTPDLLKQLIEGQPSTQPLKIEDWYSITSYEGFEQTEPYILWFWDILLNEFTQQQLRSLLAFVTASDRIPVSGWKGMTFIVQRNGGDDDQRLPTSQTCYGRLLLPVYSSKERLKERLGFCVENAWGFWMA